MIRTLSSTLLTRALLAAALIAPAADAFAAQTVLWAVRGTVDSDGDSVNDLVDNAPGTFDPSQVDTDADLIGDIIDPTPSLSDPALGDPGLGMNGPPAPIPAGSTAYFDYQMMLGVPPGAFGHIDLDFGGNGVFDATYFGPLTASINQIALAANLFVDSTWDLNTPGYYTLHAKAYGPGMSTQNVTITNVTVIPEPAALALAVCGAVGLTSGRRILRTRHR